MRTCFFYLILFFILTIPVQLISQTDREIIELMVQQEKAWNAGDLKGFMTYYDDKDSLMFIGKRGVTRGWKKTYDNYQKSYPDKKTMGELSFKLVKVDVLSDSCVFVIGQWLLKRQEPAGGHFTLVWKKVRGVWKIVYDHTS